MSNGISNKHNDLFKQPVQVSIFDSGSCRQFEKITIRDGAWRTVSIPALFACIEHPHLGLILFDTGYSSHFFKATHQLPYAIYRWMTPVEWTKEQSAVYQLATSGDKSKRHSICDLVSLSRRSYWWCAGFSASEVYLPAKCIRTCQKTQRILCAACRIFTRFDAK